MNNRLYWTTVVCALLTIGATATFAHANGRGGHGGGPGGGHGHAGAAHGGFGGGVAGSDGQAHAAGSAPGTAHGAPSVADQLSRNTRLAASLRADLPQGADLQGEASGFRNLGQFVAAVHVSSNLGIPFSQLKSRMAEGDSLGQAIHALKPGVNSSVDANDALKQAQHQITTQ